MSSKTNPSWRVVKRANQTGVRTLMITRDGGPVARTWEPRMPSSVLRSLSPLSEQDVADAYAFAAAHQMLAALKRIAAIADDGGDIRPDGPAMQEVRVAIAQAEPR